MEGVIYRHEVVEVSDIALKKMLRVVGVTYKYKEVKVMVKEEEAMEEGVGTFIYIYRGGGNDIGGSGDLYT